MLKRLLTPGALSTLLPMLVVGALGGLLSWQYHSGLRRERDLVAHTWDVIATVGELLAAATDAETGQRGYIITGDPSFLAPYREAVAVLPKLSGRARGLVADNPDQGARLDRLQTILERKLAELGEGIARRDADPDAARAFVAAAEGKTAMDEARGTVAALLSAERVLLERRTARVRVRERWVVAVGLATALLSIATRGFVDAWLRRSRPDRR